MQAAAHTPGGYGGVPQKVGRDFVDADKAKGLYRGKGKTSNSSKHKTGKSRSWTGA